MTPTTTLEAGRATDAGLSRIDQPSKNTRGYFVRVYLHGKTLSKFFSDKSYDSMEACRDAARQHRETVLASARGDEASPLGALYVTRMDYARARGWWVRVSIGGGKLVSRLFSDSEFASAEEAREVALRWRDAVATHYEIVARAAGRARRPRSLEYVAGPRQPVAAGVGK